MCCNRDDPEGVLRIRRKTNNGGVKAPGARVQRQPRKSKSMKGGNLEAEFIEGQAGAFRGMQNISKEGSKLQARQVQLK